ncbi:MAG: adenylate/guanylate cyclase domain-containing protein [Proteobacteria bacterium]|nr:adenylate/guanylate cyclase domain-containing protein [Pseudomonadota bacterium]MBU2260342.1 adenylate/guanylate cyclase domain-containing protein [Pseudomonadota bacterium]
MNALSPAVKKLLQGLLAALIGSAAALVLYLPGWLDNWEARTWDWRVRLLAKPGKATEKIHLILLDQNSLDWGSRENGLSWPWPREIYGAVVSFCKRSGVKALAFDVLYTEPSKYGVDDDRSFGAAVADFNAFAGAAFVSQATGAEQKWPAAVPEPGFRVGGLEQWLAGTGAGGIAFPRAAFPVPEVAANAAVLGNVHLDPDPDSVYRRVKLFSVFDGKVLPSLGLGAFLAAAPDTPLSIVRGAFSVGDRRVPVDGEGSAILNFRGPSGTHKAFSAASVIQSELRIRNGEPPAIKEMEVFRDSYVFFGMSAPGLFDLRPTPVSGVYPGVEIHATILDNLLSNDFLRAVPVWILAVLTILMALTAGVATSYVSGILKSFAVYAASILLPVAVCLIAYAGGFWLPLVVQEAGVAVTLFSAGVIYYSTEGRQKLFIKNAFKQYLSPAVIEELIRHPERLKLGGERRELSIFFSDLEGFTSISEGLEPEALTALLNEYLTAMTDIIQEEGGTVDKYEGDAIIAFWNAPLQQTDHALRSVHAAMRCQAKLAEMRPSIRERIGRDLRMRIGINSGPAVVGNLGSHTRFDYTMLGDAVNLASRLEGINKQFGTYTILSGATLERMEGAFPVRELSRVAVVGRKDPVTIYEPFPPEEFAVREKDLALFAGGLAAFYGGRFAEAEEVFAGLKDADPAAAAYAGKCGSLLEQPPKAWDGVWVVTSK